MHHIVRGKNPEQPVAKPNLKMVFRWLTRQIIKTVTALLVYIYDCLLLPVLQQPHFDTRRRRAGAPPNGSVHEPGIGLTERVVSDKER